MDWQGCMGGVYQELGGGLSPMIILLGARGNDDSLCRVSVKIL